METLQLLSILGEAVIAFLAILTAVRFGRVYGWCLALTFSVYVYYDLSNLYDWQFGRMYLPVAFAIATAAALCAIWSIYKRQ